MGFGLSWKNWVAYRIEAATSPYGTTIGVGETAPLHFLPLAGSESVKEVQNRLFSPTVEGVSKAPMKSAPGAALVSGSIPTCIIPGMCGSGSDGKLWNWLYARRDITVGDVVEEDQLDSATLWIKLASSNVIKKVVGARVAKFNIESPEGGAFVTCGIDIIGRSMSNLAVTDASLGVSVASIMADLYTSSLPVPEYRTKEAMIALGVVNAAPNFTNYDPDNMTWGISVDNKLSEDGFRNDGEGLLRRLYSTGREVTGTLGRDLRTNTQYAAFMNGTEQSLGLLLSRTPKSTTITLPRIVYEEGTPNSEGTREAYNKNPLTWRAMGASVVGATAVGEEILITEV